MSVASVTAHLKQNEVPFNKIWGFHGGQSEGGYSDDGGTNLLRNIGIYQITECLNELSGSTNGQ